tara:strand:- start:6208 stop:6453 length:246 start_codon:yes stop_codon:yes gene_type:complete
MGEEEVMEMSESMGMDMDMESRYIPKQINLDAIMDMNEDERTALLSLMNSNGSFRYEIRNMLDTMNIFIDKRTGTINEALK